MEAFEAFLDTAVARESNKIPGAVMAVVNSDGTYIYQKTIGTNGVTPSAPPLNPNQTFFLASCTKLITTISALQLVSRRLISLDEALTTHLPELASLPILSHKTPTGEFEYSTATTPITLRHLLTHTSGTTYEWLDPVVASWRASRGEGPAAGTTGDVVREFAYPRRFEAGQSWNYSRGLDWAGLLIERLTGMRLEAYVDENVARPLGVDSFTWHVSRKSVVAERLMRMATRHRDGSLVDGPNPFRPDPGCETGGSGLYASVHDFTRVLADLLKAEPLLLDRAFVEQMFTPQLERDSLALRDLRGSGAMAYKCTLDDSLDGVVANHGLGGLLMERDVVRSDYYRPAGTLSWSGLPNLAWGINREKGLATFFATQVQPWADRVTWDVIARFETAVWRKS